MGPQSNKDAWSVRPPRIIVEFPHTGRIGRRRKLSVAASRNLVRVVSETDHHRWPSDLPDNHDIPETRNWNAWEPWADSISRILMNLSMAGCAVPKAVQNLNAARDHDGLEEFVPLRSQAAFSIYVVLNA